MEKQKILEWIEKSMKDLEEEQAYNENSHKNGTFPIWIPKEKSGLHKVLNNWWGYESLILQLDNIRRLINKGEFE